MRKSVLISSASKGMRRRVSNRSLQSVGLVADRAMSMRRSFMGRRYDNAKSEIWVIIQAALLAVRLSGEARASVSRCKYSGVSQRELRCCTSFMLIRSDMSILSIVIRGNLLWQMYKNFLIRESV